MAHYSGFNSFNPTKRFDRHRSFFLLIHLIEVIMTVSSIMNAWPRKIEIVKTSMGIGIFFQTMIKSSLAGFYNGTYIFKWFSMLNGSINIEKFLQCVYGSGFKVKLQMYVVRKVHLNFFAFV
jgi:hypothetical protein